MFHYYFKFFYRVKKFIKYHGSYTYDGYNLARIDAPRKILFVQDKKGSHSRLEIWDVGDLLTS